MIAAHTAADVLTFFYFKAIALGHIDIHEWWRLLYVKNYHPVSKLDILAPLISSKAVAAYH